MVCPCSKQQGVPKVLRDAVQAFDTEHKETRRRDIRMSVKESCIRTFAHRVEAQQQIPKHFGRIEFQSFLVFIVLVGILNGVIEI